MSSSIISDLPPMLTYDGTRKAPLWKLEKKFLLALRKGAVEEVQHLLNAGIDVDTRFRIRSIMIPALHLSVEQNDTEMALLLLTYGASINQTETLNQEAALHVACINNYPDIADLLLEHGADYNARDSADKSPLHFACLAGSKEIALSLLQRNCELNACDTKSETPLHVAIQLGRSEIAHLLLQYGAKSDLPNCNQSTPLHQASLNLQLDHDLVQKLATRNPDNILSPNLDGYTPLHLIVSMAERRANAENCLKSMLELAPIPMGKYSTALSPQCRDGQTPLHFAVIEKHTQLVRLLIASGADPNLPNYLNMAPIDCALRAGSKEIALILLSAGANTRYISRYFWQEFLVNSKLNDVIFSKNTPPLTSICRKTIVSYYGSRIRHVFDFIPKNVIDYLSFANTEYEFD